MGKKLEVSIQIGIILQEQQLKALIKD